jgi:hypothetical protein
MAIHLTPTELAQEQGLDRALVIQKCVEHGVPVFHGRIDKTLFLATVAQPSMAPPSPRSAAA